MPSLEAARAFEEESVSFVYIDARHDYCAVLEDLWAYWPKLHVGGILAGDDYYDELESKAWFSQCANGTHMPGGVRRAVTEFSATLGLEVQVLGQTFLVEKRRCRLRRSPCLSPCCPLVVSLPGPSD